MKNIFAKLRTIHAYQLSLKVWNQCSLKAMHQVETCFYIPEHLIRQFLAWNWCQRYKVTKIISMYYHS